MLHETPCSPPVPPLMKQLANRLSPQVDKSLVIPTGEGYGSSLREFQYDVGRDGLFVIDSQLT
jgi:hypothetical protein